MDEKKYRNYRNPVRSRYEFEIFDPRTWGNGVFGAGGPSVGVADRDDDECFIAEVQRRHHVGKGPKNFRRSDERVYEDVCDALTHSTHVDATDIVVRVEDGVVELSGVAQERMQKYIAEDLVLDIPGVQEVRNLLTIRDHGRFRVPVAGWPI